MFWLGDFDESTLISVLQAAEAGALVVMNVTAGNAVGVVDALLSASSAENRDLVRTMLAAALKAVVVQRLLPAAAEGGGAVPAWEILYNTQNVAAHIRSGDHFKLPSIMAASSSEGMLLMDDCLAELVRSGYVTAEDAGSRNLGAFPLKTAFRHEKGRYSMCRPSFFLINRYIQNVNAVRVVRHRLEVYDAKNCDCHVGAQGVGLYFGFAFAFWP